MGCKKKKWIIVMMALLLFIQPFSVNIVWAADSVSPSGSEPGKQNQIAAIPVISLEQAIKIAKNNFSVPEKFTDFYSSYDSNNDQQSWTLRWTDQQGIAGEFSVRVDAVSGDIINMNLWDYQESGKNNVFTSKITQEEAQNIADDFVKKLLGDRMAQLQLMPEDQQVRPLGNYEPVSYTVRYQRVLNQVRFYGNEVTVQIAGNDGHIISYSQNWSRINVPEPQNIITAEQAQQAFQESNCLKLQYGMFTPIRPLKFGAQGEAKLIYLMDNSRGVIDAYTGKLLEIGKGERIDSALEPGGMGNGKVADGSSPSTQITPEEQKEIELNAHLLSREEAIEVVRNLVGIPENLSLRSASLSKDWLNVENSIWSFDWYDATAEKTTEKALAGPTDDRTDTAVNKPQFMYARVDAVTGELLNFRTGESFFENGEPKITHAEAQKLAEDFIKKASPERFKSMVLKGENGRDGKQPFEQSSIDSFSYQRIANGVAFPGNGINVNVNLCTGSLFSYDLTWSNVILPDTKGVLSQADATGKYLTVFPLTLSYVRIYTNGQPGEVRLVYLPLAKENRLNAYNALDAKTGELLDNQGQPLSQTLKPIRFTDIEGVEGASEIAVLGQAGLFGEFGNEFRPEQKVTAATVLRAMYLNRYGINNSTKLTDAEIMAKAKELGWIKEEADSNESIDRELLAKMLLRYISMDKFAEMEGIFAVDYQDADSISQDARGYVAIAVKADILKAERNRVYPHRAVSRAEAAVALYKAEQFRMLMTVGH